MKSAGNGDVVHGRLQVLHVHVFLAAPLGARHVAQPGADQHQGGVAVRKCPHHPRPTADLTVQPLDHIVGADARPVLTGEIAVGQRLLDTVLDLLCRRLQLHGARALLVGVNVGGAGTLVASLASLITFREYTRRVPNGGKQFLFLFSGISFAFLTILLAAMSFLNG